MKTKYNGIACLLILTASLAMVVGYYLQAAADLSVYEKMYRFKPAKRVKIPTSREIKKIKILHLRISDLAYPEAQDTTPVNLELFNHLAKNESHSFSARSGPRKPDMVAFNYDVTFAFHSDSGAYCVIDGKFYSNGSILPDGAKIIQVEHNRILIGKKGMSKWLKVAAAEATLSE